MADEELALGHDRRWGLTFAFANKAASKAQGCNHERHGNSQFFH